MKRKYINLIICSFTIFILIEILINPQTLIDTFLESTKLWFYNLLPTIITLFIINDILANYGFITIISKYFGKIMPFFKLNKKASYAFILSIISGFPTNSKLIKELLDNKEITINDANKLLTMNHFSNPLFIISTIGLVILNNYKIGLLILISHYLGNIINGLIFNNIYKYQYLDNKIIYKERKSFIKLITNSFNNLINITINILGIIFINTLIINIISHNLNINPLIKSLISSIFEITNGIQNLKNINIPLLNKSIIITFFLSFGGLSIHMQVISILKDYQINYYIYLLSRILHASISSIILFLIFRIFFP